MTETKTDSEHWCYHLEGRNFTFRHGCGCDRAATHWYDDLEPACESAWKGSDT